MPTSCGPPDSLQNDDNYDDYDDDDVDNDDHV